jgi:hypothetical protein
VQSNEEESKYAESNTELNPGRDRGDPAADWRPRTIPPASSTPYVKQRMGCAETHSLGRVLLLERCCQTLMFQ